MVQIQLSSIPEGKLYFFILTQEAGRGREIWMLEGINIGLKLEVFLESEKSQTQ